MKLHLLVKLQFVPANKKVRNKNDLDSQIWNESLILSTESIYGAIFSLILAYASNAQLELQVTQPARCCPSCRSGKGTWNTSASVPQLNFPSIWADRHGCDGVWLRVFGALKVSDYPLLSSCRIAERLQKHVEEALHVTNDC